MNFFPTLLLLTLTFAMYSTAQIYVVGGDGEGVCKVNNYEEKFKYKLEEVNSIQNQIQSQFQSQWSMSNGNIAYSCLLAYCCGIDEKGEIKKNFQIVDGYAKLVDSSFFQGALLIQPIPLSNGQPAMNIQASAFASDSRRNVDSQTIVAVLVIATVVQLFMGL